MIRESDSEEEYHEEEGGGEEEVNEEEVEEAEEAAPPAKGKGKAKRRQKLKWPVESVHTLLAALIQHNYNYSLSLLDCEKNKHMHPFNVLKNNTGSKTKLFL